MGAKICQRNFFHYVVVDNCNALSFSNSKKQKEFSQQNKFDEDCVMESRLQS